MAQFAYTFSAGSEGAAALGLSPSILLTLLVLAALACACTCYALSLPELAWRAAYYGYLISYALPALSATAAYYLVPRQRCATITALAPTDFPTVGLLGAVALGALLHFSHATGRVLRAAWAPSSGARATCARRAFAALLACSLLSACASHSAARLLAARWGWEASVAPRARSGWEEGGASLALVLLGTEPPQAERHSPGSAQLWLDTAPAVCVSVFGGAAWVLRGASMAALAWGALKGEGVKED